MRLLLSFIVTLAVMLPLQALASEEQPNSLQLEVIDPYLDVHSGPGRGYPVFYVIEQGETVDVLSRRPGWYEVRASNGKQGWTAANQISRTLQKTGEPADLPSVSYGDYVKSRWRAGFTAGRFFDGELSGSDAFSFALGYRPLSWLGLEAEAGKLFDSDVEAEVYNFNIVLEPFTEQKISPILVLGRGVMSIKSQPKLVPLDIGNSDFNNYGIGANYYIGRNFVFRGEYRWYSVSTDNSNESLATWKIGFSTFF